VLWGLQREPGGQPIVIPGDAGRDSQGQSGSSSSGYQRGFNADDAGEMFASLDVQFFQWDELTGNLGHSLDDFGPRPADP